LHSEEALYAGDKKHASLIKSLITDETRTWEAKYGDVLTVRNFVRLVLTSNEDRAAAAQMGDRRYTIIDASGTTLSKALQDAVVKEMKNGGPAALHHYLTTEFAYDASIPQTTVKTAALAATKMINADPIDAWWHDVLQEGVLLPENLIWTQYGTEPWPQEVSNQALYLCMCNHAKAMSRRGAIPPVNKFINQLDRLTGTKLKRDRLSFDKPDDDEAIMYNAPREIRDLPRRQRAIMNLPPLQQCRAAFEKHTGQPVQWDPIDHEPGVPDHIKKDRGGHF
jgi:hypothetical protein